MDIEVLEEKKEIEISTMKGLLIYRIGVLRRISKNIYSIWVDAKLQLVVDPLIILDAMLIRKNASMAIAKHPYNTHTLEEAIFTVRWHKWNKKAVLHQMEFYCKEGLQPWNPSKLPFDSGMYLSNFFKEISLHLHMLEI